MRTKMEDEINSASYKLIGLIDRINYGVRLFSIF